MIMIALLQAKMLELIWTLPKIDLISLKYTDLKWTRPYKRGLDSR